MPAEVPRRASVGAVLGRFPIVPSPPRERAGAAVFVVLRDGQRDVETLLIQRTVREDDPASGQVALPGGHVDPTDADLEAAAVRELAEEVGLARTDVRPPIRHVGVLAAPRFSLDVGVFAAELSERSPAPTRGSPREVASVFWLPSRALSDPASMTVESRRGPIEVPVVHYEGHAVWGFTLRVLTDLFSAPPTPPAGPAQGAGVRSAAGTVAAVHGAPSQPS